MTELGFNEQPLDRAAARGGLWGVAAEASTRASQSICFFVLAGVLSPKQFGAAAVAFICVQVANSLTYAGVGAAVQILGPGLRRDRTAVGLALLMGLIGAVILIALAAPLCTLLDAPDATNLVRLVALALPLAQTSEVMSALLDRELRFRTTGIAVVTASIISATAGLGMAAAGVGAAALVAQGVVQPAARLVALTVVRPAALRLALHAKELRELWQTGRELLVGQVFATASGNVDNLAVSAIAGAAALGGYGFVYNLTAMPYFLVGLAVGRVALPIYGRLRARDSSLRPAFVTALEGTSWLAALPLGFLVIAGPEALVAIFGHKWDPVSGALRILAFTSWLRTIETTSASVLIASGRAGIMRRVQQGQLLGLLIVLVPLTLADGPGGTALAVLLSIVLGTAFSIRSAAAHTGANLLELLRRVVEAGVGGGLGGFVALAVIRTGSGGLALALALLAALGSWLVTFALLRPRTLQRAVQGLR